MRDLIIGSIVASCDKNKYKVKFDNGTVKECSSSSLKIEDIVAALPPNEIPQDVREQIEEEGGEIIEDDGESDDEEDFIEDMDGIVNVGDINASADPEDIVHQTPPGTPETYQEKLKVARDRVAALLGDTTTVGNNKENLTWTVVTDHEAVFDVELVIERKDTIKYTGYKDIDALKSEDGFQYPSVALSDGTSSSKFPLKPPSHKKCTIFAKIFLSLMYEDWKEALVRFNHRIDLSNKERSGREVRRFSKFEFLVAHALLIAATCYSTSGNKLWNSGSNDDKEDHWYSILECPGFEKYMKLYRFKQFRKFLPLVFENESIKEEDPWWRFKSAVDSFNYIRNVSILLCLLYSTMILSHQHLVCNIHRKESSHLISKC